MLKSKGPTENKPVKYVVEERKEKKIYILYLRLPVGSIQWKVCKFF